MSGGPRRVVLLGATGSIGRQALEVIAAHPDQFELCALAAGSDADSLADAAARFGVRDLALADHEAATVLRGRRPDARVRDGIDGVTELAALGGADVVLNAITGAHGLLPTLAALEAGHTVALANKESLIIGGDLVGRAASPGQLVPVDSEHVAIAQCLRAGAAGEVRRIVLTASGGPFRGRRREDLASVTPADALDHPTWDMGPVITVNSATLMNKGLELVEAHLLFDVDFDRLDVVVHPQSIVHSMVEFVDGSTVAQLSPPDMRLPIQLALAWPDRLDRAFSALDWTQAVDLAFEPVDRTTFEAIDLAVAAGRRGGTYPAVLNAANEQAVAAFLAGRIGFLDITDVVGDVLSQHTGPDAGTMVTLDDVLGAGEWARAQADDLIRRRGNA